MTAACRPAKERSNLPGQYFMWKTPCPSLAKSTSSGAWLRCERQPRQRQDQAGFLQAAASPALQQVQALGNPSPGSSTLGEVLSFLDKKPTPFHVASCASSFLQNKKIVVNNESVVPVPKLSLSGMVNNLFPFICFLIADVSAPWVRQGLKETVMCSTWVHWGYTEHKQGSETTLSPMLLDGCNNSHRGSEQISDG